MYGGLPFEIVQASSVNGSTKLSLNKDNSMSRMFKPTRIRLKARGKVIWMGLAMMVSSRLWLAGVVSRTHDTFLADRLLRALCELAAELEATCWCVLMGKPLTRPVSSERFGTNASSRVTRKMTQGTFERANNLLQPSRGGTVLNTAFIERFNATMRERLATLIRKCRHAAHRVYPLEPCMYLIGSTYNFCCTHQELSKRRTPGQQKQTPAMVGGITDHLWSVWEMFWYKVAPPPWVEPKRRGRRRKRPLPDPHLPKRPRGRPRKIR